MTPDTPAPGGNKADHRITFTPETDGRSTRVEAWADGRSVSRCWIVSQHIRIGAALVRMDGIGGLGTDGDHRRQGLARKVLEAALERMHAGESGLSMLYGIGGFYERFGYVPAGPEHGISLPIDERAPIPAGWSYRSATCRDLPHLRAVYEAATQDAVGAAARLERAYAWRALEAKLADGNTEDCLVLRGPDEAVRAYVRHGAGFWAVDVMQRDLPSELVVAEAHALDADGADAVISVCARAVAGWKAMLPESAPKQAVSRVLIPAPHDGLVAAAAMRRDARLIRTYSSSGGSMARIIRSRSLLADLVPELDRRLHASGLRLRRPFLIQTEAEGAVLTAPGGRLAVGEPLCCVTRGTTDRWDAQASHLVQLALGARPPGDVLDRCRDRVPARVRELVEALFPQRCPHMHLPDRY